MDAFDALDARDPRTADRILDAVHRYALTGQGDVQRLQGRPDYRLRIGSWRIIFEFDQRARTITVTAIEPRRDAYRRR